MNYKLSQMLFSFQEMSKPEATYMNTSVNNNNYEVSPWLVSSEIVQAKKSKDSSIIRKSVITTQL